MRLPSGFICAQYRPTGGDARRDAHLLQAQQEEGGPQEVDELGGEEKRAERSFGRERLRPETNAEVPYEHRRHPSYENRGKGSIGSMDVDQRTAASLGFPKLEYVAVERERRWLCRAVPRERVVRTEAMTDLYVTGTRLRLREARPTDGSAPLLRFSRKADVDANTRLITSIYLPGAEFAVLAATLPGVRVRKLRHRFRNVPGMVMMVDEFQEGLAGLFLAEADFSTPELMADFPLPSFAVREVTSDPRYTGFGLAVNGLPEGWDRG
jgi:CYTH domain-containing protein